MKRIVITLAFSFMFLSGCASLGNQHSDAICDEIAKFANATGINMQHSVKLQNAWGSGLNNNPNLFFEVQCTHENYAPGIQLCNYLTENTSREFHSRNIVRALRCMPGSPPFSFNSLTSIASLHGEVSSWSIQRVHEDIVVTLEFSTRDKDSDPYLKITAERMEDL